MFYTIYKVTNKKNSKFYIGITSEGLQHRFRGHVRRSRFNPASNFYKALAKYGEDMFSKEILHSFEEEDKKKAYSIEQSFISNLNAVKKGYNMDMFPWNYSGKSGENNPMFGKLSGNAHSVSINGTEFNSLTEAAKILKVNRATILRWIKSDKNQIVINSKRTGTN